MSTLIAMTAIVAVSAVMVWWIILTQRRLVQLEDNITNNMSQIGAQLSGRFEALECLIESVNAYADKECGNLLDSIRARRCVITALSTPDEVQRQEGIFAEVLDQIAELAKRRLEIAKDPMFQKALGAVQSFEGMMRTSRLLFNDSVAKLNREVRRFPNAVIAGLLGFHKREYLTTDTVSGELEALPQSAPRKEAGRLHNKLLQG
ncbi:MAG: LemA family protein [Christensenellales bacterium]|jgi:LemA protein